MIQIEELSYSRGILRPLDSLKMNFGATSLTFQLEGTHGQYVRIRKAGTSIPEDVTKEVLIESLIDDEIDVIVCSDAASEGLNLQSASAIINVDVPWNPARVMQRIGRIDRLGQLSSSVIVHNLVYFDSIEERMYHWMDVKQKVIRYLGEHPELLATEESREMYQVFGVPIRERVDEQQEQNRTEVTLERLLSECKHQDSHLNMWIRHIIGQYTDLELDDNPASKFFAMRNDTILKSKIRINPGIQGEPFGYAVCEEGVRHGLMVKTECGFIPITPSIILNSEDQNNVNEYTIEKAVEIYSQEFANLQAHKRTLGFMSDKFSIRIKPIPNYTFEKC